MKTKLFMTFAVAALSIAGAKSYDLTFDQPAMVGNVKLAAGHYSLKVDATTVHFKNLDTGKTIDATGKMGTAAQKFDSTSSTSNADNGTLKVKEIDLGGTTTKIEFEALP
jgi:lipopolysaccharide export system protein LptA